MKSKEIKILLAAPRGFCAGVERAIEIVKKSIDKYGAPVYVRHEIVHNKYVVDGLKKIGAIFVEELEEIKDKSRPVIFSAHGVPKKVPAEAEKLKMEYVDATCPLVSKVHREAENLNKAGYHILLIGHKNHPEVIGTMGQLPPGSIDLVQDEKDAKQYTIKNNKQIAPGCSGASSGNLIAKKTVERYEYRLAKSLSTIINILDPHMIVLGGGLSNISVLYDLVPKELAGHVFTDDAKTLLARPRFGDASGALGAACLWEVND